MGRISTLLISASLGLFPLVADPVAVRHSEGLVHGFLALRDVDGALLATGELFQTSSGPRVTNELVFHFKDGSLHQEISVFTQQGAFRLVSWHLVEKGEAFKHPIDETLNAMTGEFSARYSEDGKDKTISEQVKVPADLANGLVTTLLKNIDPSLPKTTVSMLVATPKPRVVKLDIYPAATEQSFAVNGTPGKATHFVVHVNIGGVAGAVAPIVGKQPPDTGVWVIGGKAPGFLKSEGPMFEGGPIWRIELASPSWPKPKPELERKK